MTKRTKHNLLKLKSTKTKKIDLIIFCFALISTLLVVFFSLALTTSSGPASPSLPVAEDIYPGPSPKMAEPKTQVNLDISYSYVGPAPSYSSYIQNGTVMHLATQYPSVVRLNITRLPGFQIAACDAEVEVYGVKIATNTGETEYHAYFVGTNYNPSFSKFNESTLCPYVNDLIDHNVYSEATGGFILNWTANTSFLSHTIGSIMCYTNIPSNYTDPSKLAGLYSAGKPNTISVTVYRIGYVTMTDGIVSIYKETSNNNVKATAQLSNYEEGFLHNKIISSAKLSQIDLFHPKTT